MCAGPQKLPGCMDSTGLDGCVGMHGCMHRLDACMHHQSIIVDPHMGYPWQARVRPCAGCHRSADNAWCSAAVLHGAHVRCACGMHGEGGAKDGPEHQQQRAAMRLHVTRAAGVGGCMRCCARVGLWKGNACTACPAPPPPHPTPPSTLMHAWLTLRRYRLLAAETAASIHLGEPGLVLPRALLLALSLFCQACQARLCWRRRCLHSRRPRTQPAAWMLSCPGQPAKWWPLPPPCGRLSFPLPLQPITLGKIRRDVAASNYQECHCSALVLHAWDDCSVLRCNRPRPRICFLSPSLCAHALERHAAYIHRLWCTCTRSTMVCCSVSHMLPKPQ